MREGARAIKYSYPGFEKKGKVGGGGGGGEEG